MGKAREGFVIGDDPSVHIMGHGACASTVFVVLDLPIELHAFLLELESRFVELSVLGSQLLHPYERWGRYLPFGIIVEVVRRGSLLLGDAFDVPLKGVCHEAFMRGVMAPPTGVRARGQLWLLYEEIMERLYDVFNYPHELIIHGGWDHALHHKVANGLCGVVETKQEHYRGALDEAF